WRRRILTASIMASIAVAAAAQSSTTTAAPAGILVSRQLAERAHLTVGDVVTLAGDPQGLRRQEFRVAGVYEPTPDPMRFTSARIEAHMHLPDLVDLVADPADPGSRESLTALNIQLADPQEARTFGSELQARAPGVVTQRTARVQGEDPFAVLERFHVAISAVTMIGGTAFLLALMVIRAEERRETVGILRLVGISRTTLLLSVAVEGLLIAALGAMCGVLLAFATEGLVNAIFQARYDTALVFVRVTPSIALRAVI